MATSFERSAAAPSGRGSLQLKDRELFREQCLIDGRWLPADEEGALPVRNPATSEQLGTIPGLSELLERLDTTALRVRRKRWGVRLKGAPEDLTIHAIEPA